MRLIEKRKPMAAFDDDCPRRNRKPRRSRKWNKQKAKRLIHDHTDDEDEYDGLGLKDLLLNTSEQKAKQDQDDDNGDFECDLDDETPELQAVLLSSFANSSRDWDFGYDEDDLNKRFEDAKEKSMAEELQRLLSESEWDYSFQDDDDFKKTQKGKAIDKSCTWNYDNFGFPNSSSGHYEKGEASCSFCVICDDAKPVTSMEHNEKCGHPFCEDCVRKYVGEKIQEDVMEVKCPGKNCKKVLDIEFCESLVSDDEDLLHYWRVSRSEMEALMHPRILMCPYTCPGVFLDDRRGFPIIACPECSKLICVECWQPYHMGISCTMYEYIALAKRNQLLDDYYPDINFVLVSIPFGELV